MTGEDGKEVGWFWMLVVQYDIGFAIVVHCGFDTGTELLHVHTVRVRTCKGRQGDGMLKGSRALSAIPEYPGSAHWDDGFLRW
jgi:hypothetical protein